ncbi:MAG TPA: MFS transporter [Stellaceae bacterium]|nr:MFS transporter [Stellaceae bacterium]
MPADPAISAGRFARPLARTQAAWRDAIPSPAARRLVVARAVRSLGQGALSVDFALYARALHWSPAFLGGVIGAGLLVGAAATAAIGPLSDRHGRRRFLVGYEIFAIAMALAAIVVAARWPLAAIAAVAGWGRGANGAPVLFGAVEQAWLSRSVPRLALSRVFSNNSAAGFFGTAIGMALGGLPALLAPLLPGALSYRPLFAITAAGEAVCLLLLLHTPDPSLPPDAATDAAAAPEPALRRREHGLLLRLAGLNAMNGVGIGLSGPLLTWWFAQRYGVGPAAIGPALGAATIVCGFVAIAAGLIGSRVGAVGIVVWMRAIGLALLVALPFAPSYWVAISLYGMRMIVNRGSAGPRQALALGLVRPHRRGLAATVNSFSMQVPRAFGPAVAGMFFAAGALAAPFLLAAAFQAAYLAVYARFFAAYDPERRGL